MSPKSFRTSVTTLLFATLCTAQTPIICEDNISGQPAFRSNDVPCLLGCGTPLAMATGGLLPGSVNETDIPYCELNCVRSDASPAQSSAAPHCNELCRQRKSGNPEQLGWCMYWCVQGGEIEDMVVSTTCVPSIEYVPETTSTVYGTEVVTVEGFSNPAAWTSWYATQTAIPRSSLFVFGTPSPTSGSSMSLSSTIAVDASMSATQTAEMSRRTSTSQPASVTDGTALGDGGASSASPSTMATTSTAGALGEYPAQPAFAVAILFAVAWL